MSFSIFLIFKVVISFLTFLVDIIYSADDIKGLQVLTYLMINSNPCYAMIGIGNDAYHYYTGTLTVDGSFHLVPSKHYLTTDQLRSESFYAPCIGYSISLTEGNGKNGNALQDQTCSNCQDSTTAALLLSCHNYLSYSCINPFRWPSTILLCSFIIINIIDNVVLKTLIIHLRTLREFDDLPKEGRKLLAVAEFFERDLHVLFHMGVVAFDIIYFMKVKLEDNVDETKESFKLWEFSLETFKLISLIAFSYAWHLHVPSVVMEYDFLGYLLTCLLVGRLVNFIVSRKFQRIKND